MTPPDLRAHLQSTLGDTCVLGRELGGGGMSRVFIVDDVTLHRRLVAKILPADMAAEMSVARFQREIAVAARLQHPHIVPLLATGETQGLPYYTMPFVDGESLRERLAREGELPVAEAVRLLREIATALAYAHGQGVVHRDIKPENVLLSGGIALVTDFGVAKALIASSTATRGALTSAGVAIGTPAYMSPEQVSADPALDHRADLYAFGMVAYEMLAGASPFAGRTGQALLAAHVIDVPEPLQTRRPTVPPALAALVMRCLEKRPADRPQQAAEIVQALDALTELPATGTTRATATRLASRARRMALAFGALALVAAAAGGAWWWMGRRAPTGSLASSRLLITPFENLTGDPRFDYIGRIVADRLAFTVSQVGTMDVVPANLVLMGLRDTSAGAAQRLAALADATHAGLIVSGSVVLRGDSVAVQAQVTDVRTGRVVATVDPSTSPAADPVAAVDALGDRLLGALGSRELTILPQGGRAPKYAAYREFAAGFERFALYGDNLGSRPFFERAIAIDSTYTGAYQLLARQYLNAGEFDRADSMVRRIERLPLGVTAAERLQMDYTKAELSGDVEGLLRTMQQQVARDSNVLALALSGEAAMFLLRPAVGVPALEHAKAAYLLMGGVAARGHTQWLAESYHEAGSHGLELRTLLAEQARFPDVTRLRGLLLRAYAGLAQPAPALALADTLLRGARDSSGVALMHVTNGAEEFRAHGDARTAARLLALARAEIAASTIRASSPARRLQEGRVLLASGLPNDAVIRFADVARDGSRPDAAGYLALAQLARGDSARARVVADSLGALRKPWLFGEHTFWRAALTGALGDRETAVQLLQQASREGQHMQTWHYDDALTSMHGYAAFDALVHP